MNNRGDIPTILIFIVALVLSGISLFAMASFNSGFGDKSNDFNLLSNKADFYESFVVEKAVFAAENVFELSDFETGQKLLKDHYRDFVIDEKDVFVNDYDNLFQRVRDGEFSFNFIENEKRLFIQDIRIEATVGDNKIVKDFDLEIIFDQNNSVKKISKILE